MEIFEVKKVLVVVCAKCDRPMIPLLYVDGVCCPQLRKTAVGKTNYKCLKCGGEQDVNHYHKMPGAEKPSQSSIK